METPEKRREEGWTGQGRNDRGRELRQRGRGGWTHRQKKGGHTDGGEDRGREGGVDRRRKGQIEGDRGREGQIEGGRGR